MDISRITLNGKEYIIKDSEAQIVINELLNRISELEKKTEGIQELAGFNDGNIFIGLMNESDKDTPISYQYLTAQLVKDNVNNKVFANTDLPITVRTKWDYDGILKAPFILIPTNHKNLYSLSTPSQCFTGWDSDFTVVEIDFPSGSKQYKLFRFGNWLTQVEQPITYTF